MNQNRQYGGNGRNVSKTKYYYYIKNAGNQKAYLQSYILFDIHKTLKNDIRSMSNMVIFMLLNSFISDKELSKKLPSSYRNE